ncbi:MAG: ThiF family adenylyltransferase [Ardenticatenaceae bacterium]
MTVKQPSSESGALVEHTLSNGQTISLPPHDDFYASFTVRNRGLIPDDEQQRLRNARVLVAGCGSVGGAVIEPLVRMGAERLDLAEPDGYDLHNMNRQSVRLQDLDRNKAEVFRERMLDINPYASITVHPHGITDDNVEELVRSSAIIIDAVDVTTQKPLRAKFAVHVQAKRFRVPVIAGYDVAGLQLLHIYDYRKASTRVMHGKVRADQLPTLQPMEFLRKVVPIAAIPNEMIPELGQQLRGERQGFPQIVYTAQLFGVLALRATLDLLAERPIKKRIIVDVPTQMRTLPERMRAMWTRWNGLFHLNNEFRRSRRRAK